MLRYINADDFKREMEKYLPEDRELALKVLKSIKTADVVERKTGEWMHLGGDEWCCSACGHVICTEGSWEHPLERGCLYCEHCGAQMSEEKKGEIDEL